MSVSDSDSGIQLMCFDTHIVSFCQFRAGTVLCSESYVRSREGLKVCQRVSSSLSLSLSAGRECVGKGCAA